MTRPTSAATRSALRLHLVAGLSIRKAAAAAGISPSTLVRALQRERKKSEPTT